MRRLLIILAILVSGGAFAQYDVKGPIRFVDSDPPAGSHCSADRAMFNGNSSPPGFWCCTDTTCGSPPCWEACSPEIAGSGDGVPAGSSTELQRRADASTFAAVASAVVDATTGGIVAKGGEGFSYNIRHPDFNTGCGGDLLLDTDTCACQSSAVNNAIDAAAAAGGGKVVIPAGLWEFSGIDVHSGVFLECEAKGQVSLALIDPGAGSCPNEDTISFGYAGGAGETISRAGLKNCAIRNSDYVADTNQSAIRIQAVEDGDNHTVDQVKIIGNLIQQCGKHCLHLEGSDSSTFVQLTDIIGNQFDRARSNTVMVKGLVMETNFKQNKVKRGCEGCTGNAYSDATFVGLYSATNNSPQRFRWYEGTCNSELNQSADEPPLVWLQRGNWYIEKVDFEEHEDGIVFGSNGDPQGFVTSSRFVDNSVMAQAVPESGDHDFGVKVERCKGLEIDGNRFGVNFDATYGIDLTSASSNPAKLARLVIGENNNFEDVLTGVSPRPTNTFAGSTNGTLTLYNYEGLVPVQGPSPNATFDKIVDEDGGTARFVDGQCITIHKAGTGFIALDGADLALADDAQANLNINRELLELCWKEAIGDWVEKARTSSTGVLKSNDAVNIKADAIDAATHDQSVEAVNFDLTGDGTPNWTLEIEDTNNWGSWDYAQYSMPITDGGYTMGNDPAVRFRMGMGALDGPAGGACTPPNCWRDNLFGFGFNIRTSGGGGIIGDEHGFNWTIEHDYLTALSGGTHLVEQNINFLEKTWCSSWSAPTCSVAATGAALGFRPYAMNVDMGPTGVGPSNMTAAWTSAYWPTNRYALRLEDWGATVNYDVASFNPRARFNVYHGDTITGTPIGNAYQGMHLDYSPTWTGNPSGGYFAGAAFISAMPSFQGSYTKNAPVGGLWVEAGLDSTGPGVVVNDIYGVNVDVGYKGNNNGNSSSLLGVRIRLMPNVLGTPTNYIVPTMVGLSVERVTTPGSGVAIANNTGIEIQDLRLNEPGITGGDAMRVHSQSDNNGNRGNIRFLGGAWNTGHLNLGVDHVFSGTGGVRVTDNSVPGAANAGSRVYNVPGTNADLMDSILFTGGSGAWNIGDEACNHRGLTCLTVWRLNPGGASGDEITISDCTTNQTGNCGGYCMAICSGSSD